mgnify:CR=1 FL=1
MNLFSSLFSPIKIKSLELANRAVMPPMGTNLGNPDGTVSEANLAYIKRRAMGGAGLIITEITAVHPSGLVIANQLGVYDDRFIPGQLLQDAGHVDALVNIQVRADLIEEIEVRVARRRGRDGHPLQFATRELSHVAFDGLMQFQQLDRLFDRHPCEIAELDELRRVGLEIEPASGGSVRILGVPTALPQGPATRLLERFHLWIIPLIRYLYGLRSVLCFTIGMSRVSSTTFAEDLGA